VEAGAAAAEPAGVVAVPYGRGASQYELQRMLDEAEAAYTFQSAAALRRSDRHEVQEPHPMPQLY
jgi:hypothetical protein